ncbi:hypothetical protein [Microaceticoccus formicicus]|uniref:hypothetical protein n=1 Tax=Microaceticoccus formicicus TaxID=3118105 RepID=UPI003CD05041|nr:hypothetical protein VZL98_07300 [Peptoniphilaceae bacterium AMB_02]
MSTKITELTNKLGFESFEINEIYGIDEKTIEEFVKVQNEEVQSRVTKDGTIKLLETDKINDVYIVSLKKKFDRIEVYNGMLSNSRTNSTRFGTDLHLLFDKDGLSKLTLIYDMETTEILKDEKLISGEEILGNVKKELEQLIGVKEPEITSISLCYTTNYVDEIKDFKRMNDRDFHMEIFPQYMVVITQEVDVGDKTITDKIYKFYNAYTGEEIH